MTDEELEDIAGEYVLGTLSHQERKAAAVRLETDPRFAALVEAWENRLAPFNDDPSLSPDVVLAPDEIWDKVYDRISAALPLDAPATRDELGAPPLLTQNSAINEPSITSLIQSRNRWRSAAIGAFALAAAFVGLQAGGIYLPFMPKPAAEGRFVAVLNPQGTDPGFLIRVDVGAKQLKIERLAQEAPSGKDYELWLIEPDQQPKSLNVVGRDKLQQVSFTPDHEGEVLQFAVTLEPEGGSPTGVATGPIVFSGQLLTAN